MAASQSIWISVTKLTSAIFIGVAVLLMGIAWNHSDRLNQFNLAPVQEFPPQCLVNNKLSELEKVSISPYHGPESLVYHKGSIYTGVVEGKILRITGDNVQVFAQIESQRPGEQGRPLGLRLSPDSKDLLAVDAYAGLFLISLEDGRTKKIFPLDESIRPTFFDDFDILPNGTIIISEASQVYSYKQLLFESSSDQPNGRLISVNPETGKWAVFVDKLYFPNGVQLHRNNLDVLVAETKLYRILRVPLDGSPSSIWADGLIGYPDNIRPSPRGGYWVPVSSLRTSFIGRLVADLPTTPVLRNILKHILCPYLIRLILKYGSTQLIRLDENGVAIESWQDPNSHIPNVAEVLEHDSVLYTSSFFLPYVGRLRL